MPLQVRAEGPVHPAENGPGLQPLELLPFDTLGRAQGWYGSGLWPE